MAQHRKEQKVEKAKQSKITKCYKKRTTRRKDKCNGEMAEREKAVGEKKKETQEEETNIAEKEQRETRNFRDEG